MRSKSRRLFIDGRKLGDGGIGTFIETLVEGLLSVQDQFSLTILVSSLSKKPAAEILERWHALGVCIEIDDTSKYSLQELLILPLKWRSLIKQCDWFLSPHYTLPYFISCKSAVVVHDLIHIQYPESFLHRLIAPVLIGSALRRADLVFTVSPHMKMQLEDWCKCSSVNRKIYCIPNALAFRSMAAPEEHSGYFTGNFRILFVGADRPHKRIMLFLDFLRGLKDSGVVCTGIIVSRVSDSTRNKIFELGLEKDLVVRTDISKADLNLEYQQANLFVTTSLEEGFCIPLLDALAYQVPVLCPDREYARSLAADAGWFYLPESVEDMLRQFAMLVSKQKERDTRLKFGVERSKSFTPSEQARAFIRGIENFE